MFFLTPWVYIGIYTYSHPYIHDFPVKLFLLAMAEAKLIKDH